MSRPYRRHVEEKPEPKFFHEVSANDVFWDGEVGKAGGASNRRI
jgi:hypothetical protein